MKELKQTTKIVLAYLERFPEMPNRTLARKIVEELPGVFKSDEHARSTIRIYKGSNGDKKRKSCTIKKHYASGRDIINSAPRIPKILLFDIETSPNVSYNWGFWKQNIQHQQIVYPWIIISWAGKWLYESECFGDVLTVKEAKGHSDERICKSLLKAFNDADIIIAHNGKKFDDKRSKTRFFINKLDPPSSYQMIDTLEQYRKEFVMPSNRLDYLMGLLYDDSKLSTEFALWPKCLNWFGKETKESQQEALDYMFKYNKKDVYGLEDIYLEVRPWIKNHPNLGLYMDTKERVCCNCGSADIYEDPNSLYTTGVNQFVTMRCNNCGAVAGRDRQTLVKREKGEVKPLHPVAR